MDEEQQLVIEAERNTLVEAIRLVNNHLLPLGLQVVVTGAVSYTGTHCIFDSAIVEEATKGCEHCREKFRNITNRIIEIAKWEQI